MSLVLPKLAFSTALIWLGFSIHGRIFSVHKHVNGIVGRTKVASEFSARGAWASTFEVCICGETSSLRDGELLKVLNFCPA